MPTKAEFIKQLDFLKDDDHVAGMVWTADDIKEKAKEMKMRVSQKEATAILERMHHNADATVGISWDTVTFHLDELTSHAPSEGKADGHPDRK